MPKAMNDFIIPYGDTHLQACRDVFAALGVAYQEVPSDPGMTAAKLFRCHESGAARVYNHLREKSIECDWGTFTG